MRKAKANEGMWISSFLNYKFKKCIWAGPGKNPAYLRQFDHCTFSTISPNHICIPVYKSYVKNTKFLKFTIIWIIEFKCPNGQRGQGNGSMEIKWKKIMKNFYVFNCLQLSSYYLCVNNVILKNNMIWITWRSWMIGNKHTRAWLKS